MKRTVYIETTIPSYYCDDRLELRAEIARTREWWDQERDEYECFISPVVLDELRAGTYATQAACMALVEELPVLMIESEILEIAEAYRKRRIMPFDPAADSVHLAVATYYRLDFLLTWNCGHLANANKARQLEILNVQMGLSVPRLLTPQMLRPMEDIL